MRIRSIASCVCLAAWLSSTAAAAQDSEDALRWNPRFTRFTTAQYALTVATASGGLASMTLLHGSTEAHWRSEILLDGAARSWLAAPTDQGRRQAATVSDYMGLGLALYPFVIDSLLMAGIVHRNADVAYQLALIGLQSMLITNLVTGITKQLVGRARPDFASCKQGNELACSSQTESFLSGHTSMAFASAGLICATHQNFALYGNGFAGALACGLSLGAATAVGTLRMVADRHYFSDVLAGAALGLATGYLLPNLINYDFGGSHSSRQRTLVPIASNHQLGLAYAGAF